MASRNLPVVTHAFWLNGSHSSTGLFLLALHYCAYGVLEVPGPSLCATQYIMISASIALLCIWCTGSPWAKPLGNSVNNVHMQWCCRPILGATIDQNSASHQHCTVHVWQLLLASYWSYHKSDSRAPQWHMSM